MGWGHLEGCNEQLCSDVLPQVGPGPVSRTHSAPGEDMVPEQTHEVEENGKRHERSPAGPRRALLSGVGVHSQEVQVAARQAVEARVRRDPVTRDDDSVSKHFCRRVNSREEKRHEIINDERGQRGAAAVTHLHLMTIIAGRAVTAAALYYYSAPLILSVCHSRCSKGVTRPRLSPREDPKRTPSPPQRKSRPKNGG